MMNVMNVPFIRCLQKIYGSIATPLALHSYPKRGFIICTEAPWCVGSAFTVPWWQRQICFFRVIADKKTSHQLTGFLMSCLFILDFSVYIQIVLEDWWSCQLNNNWLLILHIHKISSERGIALKSSKNLLTLNVQNKIRYNLYGCFQK